MESLRLSWQSGNELLTKVGNGGVHVSYHNGKMIIAGSHISINGDIVKATSSNSYNLNRLWDNSGYGKDKSPSKWLSLDYTTGLFNLIEKRQSEGNNGSRELSWATRKSDAYTEYVNFGSNKGVYTSMLVALAYLLWVNSDYKINVTSGLVTIES